MITCGSCNKQYVGETTQPLHKRNNGHRSCVKAKTKNYLYEHFNANCSYSDATIQIIDCVKESTSEKVKNDLLLLEDYWIEKLGTAFPIGLNDKKKGTGNVSMKADIQYFKGNLKRYKRSRGRNRKTNRTVKSEELIKQDIENFKNQVNSSNTNIIYKTLKKYRKKDLEVLHRISQNNFGLVYSVCNSFCKEFLEKHEEKEKNERENITFSFNCKFIDKLKLKSIIADTSIIELLPEAIKPFAPMKIFYRYNAPICLSILNYSTFLKKLTTEEVRNILESSCDCENSPFLYTPLQHVITGNLEIIDNDELRTVMTYGCKYREPVKLPFNEIKQSLIDSVDYFISSKSRKYSLRISAFNDWKKRILEILNNRMNFFKVNYPNMFNPSKSIFKKNQIKNSLKRVQDKYIICRVDKAANNYAFICKKFYVKTILNELGYDENSFQSIGNDTYQPCNENEEFYIRQMCDCISNEFDITIENEDKRLARFFWNPKLHKNPYKSRFIAGARHCVTKSLNVIVNSSLKLLKNQFERYCDSIYNNSGINPFWSIDSSTKFLDKLKSCEVYNLQVYDFTTLYTKLELKEVEEMIFEVIDLVFSEINKYICIAKYQTDKCFFSKKQYNNYFCFDSTKLKKAVKFVIYNTYIIFGEDIFVQTKGIPMGGNSSSPMAELTVGKKEFNYILNLMQQKKLGLAKILSNNCRYVDDLITINYLYFQNIITEIYPISLEMERSGNDNKNVNYLDLNIKINENGPTISVYNKTDDFNFNVVSLTFPHSNIPIEVGYNVFFSQVLRYGNISTHFEDFMNSLRKTFRILLDRGYRYERLINCIKKCFQKYDHIFRKYSIEDKNIIFMSI